MYAEDMNIDLFFKYPLMSVVKNGDFCSYNGKMFIKDKDYTITVTRESTTEKIKYNIHLTDPNISQEKIQEKLDRHSFNDILQVLEFVKLCMLKECKEAIHKDHSEIYRKVLLEYSEFTRFFINLQSCKLSGDLSKIDVSLLDERNREHSIVISINYNDPVQDIFQITKCDLPFKDKNNEQEVLRPNSNLISLVDQFTSTIENLQPYFDLMEDFDRVCCILDPESPTKSDCHRRVWLGDNSSLLVTIDPDNIFNIPDMKFLGPEKRVDELRDKLNRNLTNWDTQCGVCQGILDLLELECFPQRKSEKVTIELLVNHGECCICFAQKLNDKFADLICGNKSCEKAYHVECLSEWLVCLGGKRVFNEICGKCPNCEKTITCPLVT